MSIRACVAGATGWAGRAVARGILVSDKLDLACALARQHVGEGAEEAIGLPAVGIRVSASLEEALQTPTDVLIDKPLTGSLKTIARRRT
jgi:4-hydroxy-tetrahydrodipicolinate reductase